MRKTLNHLLKPLGYRLDKARSNAARSDAFSFLKELPRYEALSVELLGKEFRIADPLSFYYSYKEIFDAEIYRFESDRDAPIILDCGANYGTSALYFKKLFPEAKVTCVEADPDIYQLLKSNLERRGFTDVELMNRAVSHQEGVLKFRSEGADGGRLLKEGEVDEGSIDVKTIHLDDIIDGPTDFLKLDIEGAEVDVLASSTKLDQVRQLFVEYHSFEGKAQRLEELLATLARNQFRYYIHHQFCSPRPLIEEQLQLDMDLQLNIFAVRRGNDTST
jgi:FkbM family methyltransferase